MDFFDDPLLTIHLIQELVLVCQEVQKKYFDLTIDSIGEFLKIPSNLRVGLESYIKVLFKEYSNFIYDNEQSTILFTKQIKEIYLDKVSKFDNGIMNSRKDEIEDIIDSKYFTELIVMLKKILLYIEVHDPPLSFKIENYKNRKIDRKVFKNNDSFCIDGFAKENKNCFLILNPPFLRNSYVYQGLKSIVIINEEADKNFQESNISKSITEVIQELYLNKDNKEEINNKDNRDGSPNKLVLALDLPELKTKKIKDNKDNTYLMIKLNNKDNIESTKEKQNNDDGNKDISISKEQKEYGLEKNFSKQEIKLINKNLTQFLLYSTNEISIKDNMTNLNISSSKEVKHR